MAQWKYAAVLAPVGLLALLAALPSLQPKACTAPLTYRIGDIDPRFGLNRAAAIDALQRAAAIWDGAEGKTLFRYDGQSDLPVNFVYGEVQETRDLKQPLVAAVERNQAVEVSLKQEISRDKRTYESAARDFQSQAASFREALNEHNERAQYWSSIRAVSPEDQSRIHEEVVSLTGERTELNARVHLLNDLLQRINFDVARYNEMVAADKENVAIVNRDAGRLHLAGIYTVGSEGKSINIFEVGDATSLVNLLAHEMGHALGMPHNGNHRSIMAPTGDDPPFDPHAIVHPKTPSPDDIAALHAICDR